MDPDRVAKGSAWISLARSGRGAGRTVCVHSIGDQDRTADPAWRPSPLVSRTPPSLPPRSSRGIHPLSMPRTAGVLWLWASSSTAVVSAMHFRWIRGCMLEYTLHVCMHAFFAGSCSSRSQVAMRTSAHGKPCPHSRASAPTGYGNPVCLHASCDTYHPPRLHRMNLCCRPAHRIQPWTSQPLARPCLSGERRLRPIYGPACPQSLTAPAPPAQGRMRGIDTTDHRPHGFFSSIPCLACWEYHSVIASPSPFTRFRRDALG